MSRSGTQVANRAFEYFKSPFCQHCIRLGNNINVETEVILRSRPPVPSRSNVMSGRSVSIPPRVKPVPDRPLV